MRNKEDRSLRLNFSFCRSAPFLRLHLLLGHAQFGENDFLGVFDQFVGPQA